MEGSKKPGKTAGMKATGESKIPKSTNITSGKETSSKATVEKETAPNLKNTTKATTTSSKLENEQSNNLQKCVKRMSVVKISKDVVNQLQVENLTSDDNLAKPSAGTKAQEKDKTSQITEKKSVRLPMKPSGVSKQDLKPHAAFGGIKFIVKKNSCRKFDTFQKVVKGVMECKERNTAEPSTKELKRTVSASSIVSKEASEKNLDHALRNKAKYSLPVKKATLKKDKPFGGMRFTPKWQSTPLKPDLLNIQKASKQESNTSVLASRQIQKNDTITLDETISIDETIILDETLHPSTKNQNYKAISPSMIKTVDNMYPAFAGIRMIPKRPSTHPKPDIFKEMKAESKDSDQEPCRSDGSTEQMKKATLNTDTKRSLDDKSLQFSTLKNSQITAFGGIRFEPKWQSTPVRPDIFEKKQKESNSDHPELHPKDSSTKLRKTVSASAIVKIRTETKHPNAKLPTTQKSESSKNNPSKKAIAPAHGGLRFKPKQKDRRL